MEAQSIMDTGRTNGDECKPYMTWQNGNQENLTHWDQRAHDRQKGETTQACQSDHTINFNHLFSAVYKGIWGMNKVTIGCKVLPSSVLTWLPICAKVVHQLCLNFFPVFLCVPPKNLAGASLVLPWASHQSAFQWIAIGDSYYHPHWHAQCLDAWYQCICHLCTVKETSFSGKDRPCLARHYISNVIHWSIAQWIPTGMLSALTPNINAFVISAQIEKKQGFDVSERQQTMFGMTFLYFNVICW